ncbi:uncharacterized protein LOC132203910 [Neocloeon triangulifer]|uniref:uncharacterized protein LOC132203910 n=1 Tax=Neocloeon triangulifer TaxID=2078957 RepID=UPI00286EE543|nr:uncharacterized protein LOC132203910 [Neocloeon triangulifer]
MAIIKIALIAVLAVAVAARPGDKDDKTSQPYEFEYEVAAGATPHSGGSSHQGHAEARVGDHSVGRYFVQLPEQGAHTRVSYTTDLWGFHPVVSYGSKSSSTRFAFGDRAIAALKVQGAATINEPSTGSIAGNLPVSIDSAAKVGNADVTETLHNIQAAGNPPIPQQLVKDLDNAKFHLNAANGAPANPNKQAVLAPALVQQVTPAPYLHAAPAVVHQQVQHLQPQPAPVVHHVQQPYLNIHEQQRQVAPVVYTEFNSNNHVLANQHHPVSVTPAPFVVSSTPVAHYASPTPAPQLLPSPHPVVHSSGGLFTASTLAPAAFSVTPRPSLYQHVAVSSTPRPIYVADVQPQVHHVAVPQKEIVHVDRPYPVEVTKYVEKPVEVTKYVDRPVEVTKIVEKPVHVPYEVTKYVDRPVEVTKFVEKQVQVPVEVTKYVDRPVQVTKYVDRPVEVTKYVDRPVHVTKYVDRPVEVTKYVDRPVQVTKFVDRPVEVTKYVDRPVIKHVPVEKTVVVPGPTVEKHIQVPVTKVVQVDRPVHHAVPVPVPHPVPYAQYVLNVPYQYGGGYGYGGGFQGKVRSESYADAALKLEGWRANAKGANLYSGYAGGANLYAGGASKYGQYTEAYLKSGFEGASLRTEGADLRGFKVSKTLYPAADYLPPVGPTKVTLTVEPHSHKIDSKGRTLCELQGSFKPPFVASRLLSTSYDDGTW